MSDQSRNIVKKLFEQSADPILLIRNERFVDCNDAAIKIMGAESKEQLLDTHPQEISPEYQPDGKTSGEKAQELFGEAATTGGVKFEWQHLKLDGTPFWVEISLTGIELDGEPAFYTIWRDITERKQVDKEIRASRERFEALFEYSPDPITLVADGRFVETNQAALDILGAKDKAEILSTAPGEISPEFQPDGQRSADKAGKMIALAIEKGRHQFEWVHRKLDGTDFWVEVSLSLVELDGMQAVYSVWRDIAERKEAEQRIREQAEAIAELSTPVVKLWDQIILLPVVGMLDTSRSQQMTERVLEAIVSDSALVVILDVTGVAVIDTAVARHLLQTMQSAKILGAEVVVTGFSPASAQTLAQLGVDFSQLRTRGSLRAGVQEALAIVGREVV